MERQAERIAVAVKPIAPGMAVGPAHVFRQISLETLRANRLEIDSVPDELGRLGAALAASREQVDATIERSHGILRDIFLIQRHLLADPALLEGVEEDVRAQRVNLEHAVAMKMLEVERRFETTLDSTIRARAADTQDAYHRLLRNLLGIEHVRGGSLRRASEPFVLVATRLLPSDLALIAPGMLIALVTEEGSCVSHVALIARSLRIPAVIEAPGAASVVRSGDPVLVDAVEGRLILFPAAHELRGLRTWKRVQKARAVRAVRRRASRTADGVRVRLLANIASERDATEAKGLGLEGAGLLRSEFFYLRRTSPPTIDEEFSFYRSVAAALGRLPLTVRLLDIGADKTPSFMPVPAEANPQLGRRGVRFLFANQELLERHLTAVLRLCRHRAVGILLPFVSTEDDLDTCCAVIDRLRAAEGAPAPNVRLGIMVETPSVALDLESYIRKVDFVSIGTNDLVQYLFAVSREDSGLDRYRRLLHPVVLRLIHNIAQVAGRHGKETVVCGEASADPLSAAALVCLGVRTLSMQAEAVPRIRSILARVDCSTLNGEMVRALEAGPAEPERLLCRRFPDALRAAGPSERHAALGAFPMALAG